MNQLWYSSVVHISGSADDEADVSATPPEVLKTYGVSGTKHAYSTSF